MRGPATPCPHCGHVLDGHTHVSGDESIEPDDGSAAVCVYCGGISIFEDFELREPDDDELLDMLDHPDIGKAMWVADRFQEMQRRER